jgi:hypothetical protein
MTEDEKREVLGKYLERLAAELRHARWEKIEFEVDEDNCLREDPFTLDLVDTGDRDIKISMKLRGATDRG